MQDGNSSLAPRIHPQGVMAKVLPVRVENIEIKDVLRYEIARRSPSESQTIF
jgi:hypothetical protein